MHPAPADPPTAASDLTASHPRDEAADPSTPIALLGLGPMGVALSRQLLAAGHPLTVWNRSERDLDRLALHGANLEPDAATAVGSADVVVLCLRNREVSGQLIADIAPALPDDVVVLDTSSGTPEQARRCAADARALGIAYVSGAIMVPTPMVGTPECLVLYAGEPQHLSRLAPVQRAFAGSSDLVGADHALPSALDLAMLDIYFVGMYGFLHAAAVLREHEVSAHRFLPYASSIVETLGGSLEDLARSIDTLRFDTGEARLDMCLAILEHLVEASDEAGVDHSLPAVVRDATLRAAQRWPDETDWDCVVTELLPARS